MTKEPEISVKGAALPAQNPPPPVKRPIGGGLSPIIRTLNTIKPLPRRK